MHYFIDGYNLLFRVIKALKEENLQQQREHLIEDLSQKIALLKIDATFVFDSTYHPGLRQKTFCEGVEILFTDEGETADECIIDELKRRPHPRAETVITSDKKLAWQARLCGAHTETIEQFLSTLNQRYRKRVHAPKEAPEVKKSLPDYSHTFEEADKKPETDFDRWLRIFEEESNGA